MCFRVRSVKPDVFSTLKLPWAPFRTLEGSLGDPFGPRRLPWGPFRDLQGSLRDPFGPRRLPWGPLRALEGSLGDPPGPLTLFGVTSGRRQGDVGETSRDLFLRLVPPRGRAPRPPSALLRNKEKKRNSDFEIRNLGCRTTESSEENEESEEVEGGSEEKTSDTRSNTPLGQWPGEF